MNTASVDKFSLTGQLALITGGGSGIGGEDFAGASSTGNRTAGGEAAGGCDRAGGIWAGGILERLPAISRVGQDAGTVQQAVEGTA